MKPLSILSLQYYWLLLLYNIAFTSIWLFLFAYATGFIDATAFFFAKIAGFLSAVAIHFYVSSDSYFYFRNAGYQVRRILINCFAIDLLIFFLSASIFKLFAYAFFKG